MTSDIQGLRELREFVYREYMAVKDNRLGPHDAAQAVSQAAEKAAIAELRAFVMNAKIKIEQLHLHNQDLYGEDLTSREVGDVLDKALEDRKKL